MYKVRKPEFIIDRRSQRRPVTVALTRGEIGFIFGCCFGALLSSAMWMAVFGW